MSVHTQIVGQTLSGKTTLAIDLVRQYTAKGINTIVFDPMHDKRWDEAGASFKTDDFEKFIEVVTQSRQCAVFIDEAGDHVGQGDKENFWLGRRSRHLGHRVIFISQRAVDVARTVRDQCGTIAIFNIGLEDSKVLSQEWGKPEIRDEASNLPAGICLWCKRLQPIQKINVFK